MLIAEINWFFEPAEPWSTPHVGMPAMLAVALALVGLTVWTYVGARKAAWTLLGAVLSLRLLALLLAFALMMRPSFGVTHLEGVEVTKLLVVFDASESMKVDDAANKTTRWDQINRLWGSRAVQGRLEQLAGEQKIEVVKYLGAEGLRPDEPGADATGKRTDIGAWLHELRTRHGHEKQLRGVALFSDGGDNGTRYSTLEEARAWRGICPVHTFGAGNPSDPRFGKDLVLSNLIVRPALIPIKSKMEIEAVLQAPGYEKSTLDASVWMEHVETRKAVQVWPAPAGDAAAPKEAKIVVGSAKKQKIQILDARAPNDAGEYKLTLKVAPKGGEPKDAREIATFVKVIKEKIKVLWVDRARFWEPVLAIRALAGEDRFEVKHIIPAADGSIKYDLDTNHYDVIVIGDLSVGQFSKGQPKDIFKQIRDQVMQDRTGLLLLGGADAFANGGWDQTELMDLMPVTFEKKKFAPNSFDDPVVVVPTAEGLQVPFLQLAPTPKLNLEFWRNEFTGLDGVAPLGAKVAGSTEFLTADKGKGLVMAATRKGTGVVVVFGADSTWSRWLNTPVAAEGYHKFWKQLILYLGQQEDKSKPLRITLDQRRIGAGEPLNFTVALLDKNGKEVSGATFKARVVGPDKKEHPVTLAPAGAQRNGAFAGARDPGEYQLEVAGNGKVGNDAIGGTETARFLVEAVDLEMTRPAADHDTLSKLAAAADGRFRLAEEAPLLQFLDELKGQVNGESRLKTTKWPDWKRLPTSESVRDQVSGLWHSFSLAALILFVLLLGGEWLLRRWWGLV